MWFENFGSNVAGSNDGEVNRPAARQSQDSMLLLKAAMKPILPLNIEHPVYYIVDTCIRCDRVRTQRFRNTPQQRWTVRGFLSGRLTGYSVCERTFSHLGTKCQTKL